MKRLLAFAAALALVAACSSERSSSGDSTEPTDTTTVDTTSVATTTASTTPATAPATTIVEPTTTTGACVPEGDTLPQESDDPLLMSSLVGMDIRTGRHPCFERIVIELSGTGEFPGWSVGYVDDPVRLGESDEFAEIEGVATLQIVMRMWMTTMEGDGYQGEIDLFPSNVAHILEMRQTENFEGMCIWSIGLDAEYPFTVHVLHSPERLVIDVQVPIGS